MHKAVLTLSTPAGHNVSCACRHLPAIDRSSLLTPPANAPAATEIAPRPTWGPSSRVADAAVQSQLSPIPSSPNASDGLIGKVLSELQDGHTW